MSMMFRQTKFYLILTSIEFYDFISPFSLLSVPNPQTFFSLKRIHLLIEIFGRKTFEFGRIPDFLCPSKVALELLRDRV